MSSVDRMLETHPKGLGGIDHAALAACIDACAECATTCTACADACLVEDSVADLTDCITTDLACADICATTARVLTRRTGAADDLTRALLETCAAACRACGDECAQHESHHEHCAVCAAACRRCEQACRDLLEAMG